MEAISARGTAAWPAFVELCTPLLLRIVGLFARTYDERMDLFLFVCSRLRENDMKRLRSFRYRAATPCRFTTWLSVVVRNLALDHDRARRGRFRPFREFESLNGIERAVFEGHLRDGLPLDAVRGALRKESGIEVDDAHLIEVAGRLRRRLSPSQRWRLLARLAERRNAEPLDPIGEGDRTEGRQIVVADESGGPEDDLRRREAAQALRRAMASVRPRVRLTLALRYRDGLSNGRTALALGVSPSEADRLTREGLGQMREQLSGRGLDLPDFVVAALDRDRDRVWPEESA